MLGKQENDHNNVWYSSGLKAKMTSIVSKIVKSNVKIE